MLLFDRDELFVRLLRTVEEKRRLLSFLVACRTLSDSTFSSLEISFTQSEMPMCIPLMLMPYENRYHAIDLLRNNL